jgi:transposase InsO family protein
MAEALNSLFKAELVRNRGPWRGIDDLEIATVEYIDWYNNRRPTANSATSHPPSTRPYTR